MTEILDRSLGRRSIKALPARSTRRFLSSSRSCPDRSLEEQSVPPFYLPATNPASTIANPPDGELSGYVYNAASVVFATLEAAPKKAGVDYSPVSQFRFAVGRFLPQEEERIDYVTSNET